MDDIKEEKKEVKEAKELPVTMRKTRSRAKAKA
jgi:hypothetical protein